MNANKNFPSAFPFAGLIGVIFLLGPFLCSSGMASTDPPPPRVSHIEGTAAYEPAGDVDWSEVAVNLPLLSGDRIFSHPEARVEVEIGYEDFLRLTGQTDVSLIRAVGEEIELTLHLGSVILRVQGGNRYVVNTPMGAVQVQKRGLYRVTVNDDGPVVVSVRKGRVEVANGLELRKLETGQELIIEGPQSTLANVVALSGDDSFDLWSDRRDARQVASTSVARVGGGYVHGVYDLDYYGHWDSVSGYGHVWFPSVYVGWVPYRSGRWTHYPRWGWTWVSYEPWGWLPYHYGSWVYYSPYSRWCWVPSVSFSFWSPALVNFYFGGGYVGWAPRGYGHTTIVNDNSVTVINKNTTIVNGWTRRGPNDGLTMVRSEDFGSWNTRNAVVQNPDASMVENLKPGLPNGLATTSRRARTESASAVSGVDSGRSAARDGSGPASERGSAAARASSSRTRSSISNSASTTGQPPGSTWSSRAAQGATRENPASTSVRSTRQSPSAGNTGAVASPRTAPAGRPDTGAESVSSRQADRGGSGTTWSVPRDYRGNNTSRSADRPGVRQEPRIITIPRRDPNQGPTSRSGSTASGDRTVRSERSSAWSSFWGSRSTASSRVDGSARTRVSPSSSDGPPSRSGSQLGSRSRSVFGSRPGVTVTRPRSSNWSGSRSIAPRLSGSSPGPSIGRSIGSRSMPSVRSAPSSRGGSASSGVPSARRGNRP